MPTPQQNHVSTDLGGGVRLRWEQHGEFHTCTFWKQLGETPTGFDAMPHGDVPHDWLHAQPGQWLVGLQVLVEPAARPQRELPPLVRQCLAEDSLVGARVMDGAAEVYTDFRLQGDGYARWIVVAGETTPRRLGRLVQRLLEVETYRMMALLGLPVAREVGAALVGAERALADVADRIRIAQPSEEPELLRAPHRARRRGRGPVRAHARTLLGERGLFRVDAAAHRGAARGARAQPADAAGVHGPPPAARDADLRVAARRQQALSERISRVSNLLRTRVEIEQQQSSRALLDAMNRRQKAQLLLQSAVEGLSVAAVTYYGAGLVGYLAKGTHSAGLPVVPDVAVAVSIPLIAIAVWLGIRRLHRRAQAAAD